MTRVYSSLPNYWLLMESRGGVDTVYTYVLAVVHFHTQDHADILGFKCLAIKKFKKKKNKHECVNRGVVKGVGWT